MARSTGYGFYFRRHLTPGVEKPATLEVIIANSAKVAVGEAVYWDGDGFAAPCPADTAMLGIVSGIVTEDGENVFKTNESHGGTLSGDDTFTAGSSNETSQKVKVQVIVDQMALFEGVNADALTQAEVGEWFNGVANTNTGVDGTTGTGSAYSAGTQQFQLVERVTTDLSGSSSTTRGLFRIGRSQLINDPTA